jgi:hypothetical protein
MELVLAEARAAAPRGEALVVAAMQHQTRNCDTPATRQTAIQQELAPWCIYHKQTV